MTEPERDDIDKVAEALRLHGDLDTRANADYLAQVVIDALQLTKEWTWSWPNGSAPGVPGYGFSVPTREEAESEGDSYMRIVSRLVGPWVEGER